MNNKKTLVVVLLFFLFVLQVIDIQAQNFQKKIDIEWQKPLEYAYSNGEVQQLLYFKDAVSAAAFPTLPAYFERFHTSTAYDEFEIKVENEVFVPMTSEEISLIPSDFTAASIGFHVENGVEKKQNYACLSFIPIRKVGGGRYEKLVSASVLITPKGQSKMGEKSKTYVANSVLQRGNWYKVGVKNTGIYKISFAELKEMGIVDQPFASQSLSVFGNGGAMLPEKNVNSGVDDLQELPVWMADGGDGMMGEGDYLLFYAEGPHSWTFSSSDQRFEHHYNLYHSEACYFVNVEGIGAGKRILTEDNASLVATTDITTYDAYGFYEEDLLHIGEGGRNWYGDKYDAVVERSYSLNFPPVVLQPMRLTLAVAATSARASSFSVLVNNQSVGRVSVSSIIGNDWAEAKQADLSFLANGTTNVTLQYEKSTYSSIGYLNYIEWQALAKLTMFGNQMPFCSVYSIGNGNVARFQLENSSSSVQVWDVTSIANVKQMQGSLFENTFSFKATADSLRKFIAFNGNAFYSVSNLGRVLPQNLHGTSQVDMVIIAYPDFVSQAEKLADFHRQQDGLSVKVVTPQQVYNEFSSGAQDVTAIRDYMRMIYDKSNGQYPRYLLLFGRPSYDYRNIEGTCKLYVPNYQSASAMSDNSLRANDDYFALLDEGEGENCVGMVDLAVGRFPATTVEQAAIAVQKTIQYSTAEVLGDETGSSNYGDWKNVLTFVADDEDGTTHISAADQSATISQNSNADINIEKIYLDAYQQVTYSASERYPDVTKDINHRMNRGCLLFTYVGHGGKYGWAAERIIELADIRNWQNKYNLPWMVTLTCEFGWYDRAAISPAELAFFNANGGVAGLVTTARVAFTGSNLNYGNHFYTHIFDKVDGRPITIGEINRLAKNNSGGAINSLNMLYVLGDPAMRLKIPEYKVVTDSINGVDVASFTDTLRALTRVTVVGHIENSNGSRLNDFSGTLLPSIYDKKIVSRTLQNDVGSGYFEFEEQKNVLFKGNVTVHNGGFKFSFMLPKDINYAYGNGKFSYYAHGQMIDATGNYSNVIIGGMGSEILNDDEGPEIEVYMNDDKFVSGGTVNTSPTLFIKLKDDYGINTTGSGIGHDLVAILDDGDNTILNDYYVAEKDSFNCGTVRYPYENLSLGKHTLKVRAWDILNNVSEKSIDFVVASSEGLTLDHVLNYPNPFTTHTSFYFEHNKPNTSLDIVVSIFTISGKLVKTLTDTQMNTGFRSNPIEWNGRDDYGDKLGKGTYVYRLKVRTADGQQAEKIEKIVLL